MVEKCWRWWKLYSDCFLLDQNKVISDGERTRNWTSFGPYRPRAIWRGVERMIHTILSECPLIIQAQIGMTPHHIICIYIYRYYLQYMYIIHYTYINIIYIYTSYLISYQIHPGHQGCFFLKSSKHQYPPEKVPNPLYRGTDVASYSASLRIVKLNKWKAPWQKVGVW